MRRNMAELLNISDDALRNKQQALYQQTSLRTFLPGRSSGVEGLRATAGAAALITLAAMIAKAPTEIGVEVAQLWESPCLDTGDVPVVRIGLLCGAGLILLLERADIRRHLDQVVINQDVPHGMFIWRARDDQPGRRTVFAPFASAQLWEQRVAELGMTRATQLSGEALSKIAALVQRGVDDAR
jgi:hypothetical protein